MAIRSSINQYFGVNAHLVSYFQQYGGWDGFHGNFIVKLAEHINQALPDGYLVDIEKSLQIKVITAAGEETVRRYKPDVAIFETESSSSRAPEQDIVATFVQPLVETYEDDPERYYAAVVIYSPDEIGRPTTRLELLSPTNKQGTGREQYIEKRMATLKSGTYLVEIDLLHETPSPIKGVPPYPQGASANPYSITINAPLPDYKAGTASTYGFVVDEKIPTLNVPIGTSASIPVQFNTVFQQTFRSLKIYAHHVDYEQRPVNLDRYSPADQTRILGRMRAVQEAVQSGLSLENGPFFTNEDETQ